MAKIRTVQESRSFPDSSEDYCKTDRNNVDCRPGCKLGIAGSAKSIRTQSLEYPQRLPGKKLWRSAPASARNHERPDNPGDIRGWHVHISIRHHSPDSAINDSSIDTGDVIQILVGDMKRSCRRQMTGAAGANLGFHDCSVVAKKISLLLREIQLHGVLGKSQP
jgi:hypothetical protein